MVIERNPTFTDQYDLIHRISLMFPYGRQQIDEDDIQAVAQALKGDFLTTGPLVETFENALCDVTGARYAVACSNGTTALHLACMAIGLQAGDYAIVPSVTFLATANAVRYCGAEVFFADVDPETGLMRPDDFQQALVKAHEKNLNVRAVLPVHLTGRACDLEAIGKIAKAYDVHIIADSCHALGGEYKNYPIGACQFEQLSTFSFHPVKTIATGEGGAITTNDCSMAQAMRQMRHHHMQKSETSLPWSYEMHDLGFNYRLSDIQCALGISQLKKIRHFITKRQEIVKYYNKALSNISAYVRAHYTSDDHQQIGWHLYAARIDFDKIGITRQTMMNTLKDKGIGTQVHYIPIHTQPYYQKRYAKLSLPNSEAYYEKTLSLPLYPSMEKDDVQFIVDTLKHIID